MKKKIAINFRLASHLIIVTQSISLPFSKVKNLILFTLMFGLVFSQAAGGVNYKKLKVQKDSFEGITKHYASLKAKNSRTFGEVLGEISGFKTFKYSQYYQIVRAQSDDNPNLINYALIITLKGDGWIFMEEAVFKNRETKWTKKIKWDMLDTNQKYIFDGIISETISIILSEAEVIEMLSQPKYLVRIYGKERISDSEISTTKSSDLMLELINSNI